MIIRADQTHLYLSFFLEFGFCFLLQRDPYVCILLRAAHPVSIGFGQILNLVEDALPAGRSDELSRGAEKTTQLRRRNQNERDRIRGQVTSRVLHIAWDVNEVSREECLPLQAATRWRQDLSLTRDQVKALGITVAMKRNAHMRRQNSLHDPIRAVFCRSK